MLTFVRSRRARPASARAAAFSAGFGVTVLLPVLAAGPGSTMPAFMTRGHAKPVPRVNHTPNAVSARVAADAKRKKLVFITDDASPGDVLIFEQGALSTPIGTISNLVSVPTSAVVDGSGNLYVANSGNSTVTKYAPPYDGTPTVYAAGLSSVIGAAVSANGTLYVVDQGVNGAVVYPPGSTTPSGTLTGSASGFAYQAAVDASGNAYLGYGCGCTDYYSGPPNVFEFVNGKAPGVNLNLQGLQGIGGMGFDHKGDLVVDQATDVGFPPVVSVFAPNATVAARTIQSPNFLLPWSLAFDQHEKHLYVGNVFNNNVEELDYATGAVVDRFIGTATQSIGYGVGLSPSAP